jgi:succinate dehydrogenase/fumarate reductase cytochrome b subunit
MKAGQSAAIIRAVHKWTGLTLILLVGAKLISGFAMAGAIEFVGDRAASLFHFSKWVDVPLVVAFSFHALYGVLRAFWTKIRKKDLAFVIASILAVILSIWGVVIIY